MTGGDASFEQALTAACFLAAGGRQSVLVGGADEMHPIFSALFDRSVTMADTPSDGGGMLLLETAGEAAGLTLQPGFLAPVGESGRFPGGCGRFSWRTGRHQGADRCDHGWHPCRLPGGGHPASGKRSGADWGLKALLSIIAVMWGNSARLRPWPP